MPNLILEEWKSTTNLTERHYFLDKPHQYVFGFNPEIIKPHVLRKILKIIKEEAL